MYKKMTVNMFVLALACEEREKWHLCISTDGTCGIVDKDKNAHILGQIEGFDKEDFREKLVCVRAIGDLAAFI